MTPPETALKARIMLPAHANFSGADVFRRSVAMFRIAPEGLDWIAVTTARMKGWKTRNFPEKRFHHYRTLGTAERTVGASFLTGKRIIIWVARRSGNSFGWLIG